MKILSSSADKSMKIWQITFNNSLEVSSIYSFGYFNKSITALAIINYQYIAMGYVDGTITILDILYFNPAKVVAGHTRMISSMLSIANGQYLASGSLDKKIIIWDSSFNKFNELNVQNGQINSLTILKNETYLVSSSMDASIVAWKANSDFTLKYNFPQKTRQIEGLIELKIGYLTAASDDF